LCSHGIKGVYGLAGVALPKKNKLSNYRFCPEFQGRKEKQKAAAQKYIHTFRIPFVVELSAGSQS